MVCVSGCIKFPVSLMAKQLMLFGSIEEPMPIEYFLPPVVHDMILQSGVSPFRLSCLFWFSVLLFHYTRGVLYSIMELVTGELDWPWLGFLIVL